MKIEQKNVNSLRLSSLAEGDVFECGNALYLKTNEVIDGKRTCVRLRDGLIDWFDEECFVRECDAKVVVE